VNRLVRQGRPKIEVNIIYIARQEGYRDENYVK